MQQCRVPGSSLAVQDWHRGYLLCDEAKVSRLERCPETHGEQLCHSCLLKGVHRLRSGKCLRGAGIAMEVLRVAHLRAHVSPVPGCVCVYLLLSLKCILIAGPSLYPFCVLFSLPASLILLFDCLSVSVASPLAHLECLLNCFSASSTAAGSPAIKLRHPHSARVI